MAAPIQYKLENSEFTVVMATDGHFCPNNPQNPPHLSTPSANPEAIPKATLPLKPHLMTLILPSTLEY